MKQASSDGKAREGHFSFNTESKNGKDYLTDLNFCLDFALENRYQIMERVEYSLKKYCGGGVITSSLINRNHNHVELKGDLLIHRKGTTHAEKGMLGVIPGNMRDGSFIIVGKGNEDSLSSSSHGAGRISSRKQARENTDIKDFQEAMEGVTAKVDDSTLDESPFAYKNILDVMELQKDLVEVIEIVKPLINIKA